VKFYGDRPNE